MTAPHQNLLGTSGAVDTEETDPNFNQTVLLLHGDGTNGGQNNTFADSSSSGHSITRSGNATQGTFNPFLGEGQYGVFFGPNNDDLEFVNFNGSAFDNDGVFCIELFITKTVLDNTTIFFSSDTNDRIQVFMDTSNNFGFSLTGNASTTFLVPSGISAGVFNHFCITRDSSNNVRGFINGVLKAYKTNITTSQELTDLHVGSQKGVAHFHRGAISNVRFVAGSLPTDYNTTETATGTTCFTIPSEPLTLTSQGTTGNDVELLCCQSNRFIDNSNNGITPTVSNTPKVTPLSPFAPTASYSESVHGGSVFLGDGTDNSGDYIHATLSSAIGTGDMTVEFWFYPTSFYDYIAPFSVNASGTRANGFNIGSDQNGKLKFVDSDGTNYESGNNQLQLNSWNHIAATREGSTVRVFHNGTQIGTVSNSDNWTGTIVAIGVRADDFTKETATGYIANCNLVVGTAKYDSSGYTIPLAPITAHANTKFLTNFTNAEIIDSTMKSNLETVDAAQIDTSVKKFGTGSIQFDGTNDKLVIPHQEIHQLGTGEFTVELFVYFTSTDQRQGFFGNDQGWYFQIYDGELEFALSVSAVIERSFSHSINQWYHLAATRDSSNDIRLFIDGTQQGAVVNSTADLRHASNDFHIGNIGPATSRLFKGGYMDEIRITKGVARYTGSSFTVPTKAFANK
jgi:hypothetical protein